MEMAWTCCFPLCRKPSATLCICMFWVRLRTRLKSFTYTCTRLGIEPRAGRYSWWVLSIFERYDESLRIPPKPWNSECLLMIGHESNLWKGLEKSRHEKRTGWLSWTIFIGISRSYFWGMIWSTSWVIRAFASSLYHKERGTRSKKDARSKRAGWWPYRLSIFSRKCHFQPERRS